MTTSLDRVVGLAAARAQEDELELFLSSAAVKVRSYLREGKLVSGYRRDAVSGVESILAQYDGRAADAAPTQRVSQRLTKERESVVDPALVKELPRLEKYLSKFDKIGSRGQQTLSEVRAAIKKAKSGRLDNPAEIAFLQELVDLLGKA